MLGSAQTALRARARMTRMMNRLRGWWQLWMMLAVMWTVVVIAYGWMNLPRAQYMPHDPQFLSQLSNEAASILRANNTRAKPVRGALVWSDDPRMIRMSNGTQLMFPAATTDERAAFVAREYHQLLDAEAGKQRWPYVLELLMLWLAPLLIAALAIVGTAGKRNGSVVETHPASLSF
jgi:hypothetical protein